MRFGKYAGDYRLENETGSNGKIRTKPVYTGKYYSFTAAPETMSRYKRGYLILLIAVAVFFALGLFQNGVISRRFYVVAPYACCFWGYLYLGMALSRFFTQELPYTREQKEKSADRLNGATLCVGLLSLVAAVAGGVSLILLRETLRMPGDLIFFLCALVQCLLNVWMFLGRKAFAMEETSDI